MTKHFTRTVLAAALLSLTPLAAQAADLLSIYRDALAYDAQFGAARASLEAGRERLPQGLAGLLPTLGLGASTTWNRNVTEFRGPPGLLPVDKLNRNGWTLTLTQPLLHYANWVSYTQSELAVVQAEAQFEAARMDLIVRASQAYFDVLLAEDALATAQAKKTAIAEQLEAAKRNFEVGTSTITDTHEAQAAFDLAVAQEIAADNELTVRRHALVALVGKEPGALKRLRPGVDVTAPQPNDMGKWVEMAEASAPAIQIAQAGMEIAEREISRQRAGHYPTVDLVATRGFGAQTGGAAATAVNSGVEINTTTVGLQLNVPLFSGGFTSSKHREAISLKDKARADFDNARRNAALTVRQTYLGVTSGLAQIKAFDAALTSSKSSLDSNKLGYDVGVRINIDVLNAQSQLYDTRQKLSKARLDTITSLFRLKAAAGALSEADLDSVNQLLGE